MTVERRSFVKLAVRSTLTCTVAQRNDTSSKTEALIKLFYSLHSNVGTIVSHDKLVPCTQHPHSKQWK